MWRILLLLSLCTAAKAQEVSHGQVFFEQCISGQFRPGKLSAPIGFADAEKISQEALLAEVPKDLFTPSEVWLLNPDFPEDNQIILAWGTMPAHPLGPMEVCLLLSPRSRSSVIQSEFLKFGASQEGGFFFFIQPDTVWMVNTNGSDSAEGGKVAIIGITPSVGP